MFEPGVRLRRLFGMLSLAPSGYQPQRLVTASQARPEARIAAEVEGLRAQRTPGIAGADGQGVRPWLQRPDMGPSPAPVRVAVHPHAQLRPLEAHRPTGEADAVVPGHRVGLNQPERPMPSLRLPPGPYVHHSGCEVASVV